MSSGLARLGKHHIWKQNELADYGQVWFNYDSCWFTLFFLSDWLCLAHVYAPSSKRFIQDLNLSFLSFRKRWIRTCRLRWSQVSVYVRPRKKRCVVSPRRKSTGRGRTWKSIGSVKRWGTAFCVACAAMFLLYCCKHRVHTCHFASNFSLVNQYRSVIICLTQGCWCWQSLQF